MTNQDGKLSTQEIDEINRELKKKGIPTDAKELIDKVDLLIPESRNPKKFDDDIKE